MTSDPLEQLLRRADEQAAAPPMPRPAPEIADRAWRRRVRGHRTRMMAGTALGVAVILASSWVAWHARSGQDPRLVVTEKLSRPTSGDTSTVQPGPDWRQLAAEADRRGAVADRLAESARVRDRSGGTRVNARRRLAVQQEQAALLLLYQGDRLAQDPSLREPAAVAYRQASELFPETHGAATARQRLGTPSTETNGGT